MFADLFIVGLVAHLFADWFLQTEWQSTHVLAVVARLVTL